MSGVIEFQLDPLPDFALSAKKAQTGMQKALKAWGNAYITTLVTTRLHGRPGLNRRSGNLARDWVVEADTSSTDASITIKSQGIANAYAGLQERGGTIKPKSGRFLWIPIGDNVTKNGTAKLTPTQAIAMPHFISWSKGPVFFGKAPGKQTKKQFAQNFGITPLFLLRTSVTVPARMGAAKLFQEMIPNLEDRVSSALQEAFN